MKLFGWDISLTSLLRGNNMSTISINGVTYVGNNVRVNRNKVYIDGKLADTENMKDINIVVQGDIENIKVDACQKVTINGTVKNGVETQSGDIDINQGSVEGNVSSMSGNIDIGGSVGGSVKTMSGNIKHR